MLKHHYNFYTDFYSLFQSDVIHFTAHQRNIGYYTSVCITNEIIDNINENEKYFFSSKLVDDKSNKYELW